MRISNEISEENKRVRVGKGIWNEEKGVERKRWKVTILPLPSSLDKVVGWVQICQQLNSWDSFSIGGKEGNTGDF